MSELSSLYIKLNIKKEQLENFLQQPLAATTPSADWTAWWESREMYSPGPLPQIPAYSQAVMNGYLKNAEINTFTQQPDGRSTWECGILFFSENYYEILPMLAWLKSITPYLETEGAGFAIIYDYFWGGTSVMAHLEFKDQEALFTTLKKTKQLAPAMLDAANAALQKAAEILSKQYGND